LYFTTTALSPVGFGDIGPKSDAARMLVSAQMRLDLVLISVIARLLFGAARLGNDQKRSVPSAPTVPPAGLTSSGYPTRSPTPHRR